MKQPTFNIGPHVKICHWRVARELSISTSTWLQLIKLTNNSDLWALRPPYLESKRKNTKKYRGVFTCVLKRFGAKVVATVHVRSSTSGPAFLPFRLAKRLGMYNHSYYLRSGDKLASYIV